MINTKIGVWVKLIYVSKLQRFHELAFINIFFLFKTKLAQSGKVKALFFTLTLFNDVLELVLRTVKIQWSPICLVLFEYSFENGYDGGLLIIMMKNQNSKLSKYFYVEHFPSRFPLYTLLYDSSKT